MSSSPTSSTRPARLERIALLVVAVIAGIAAGAAVVAAVVDVALDLTAARLDLPVDYDRAASRLPEGSRLTEATLAVVQPSGAERALLATGHALGILTVAVVAYALLLLCLRVRRGSGFTRSLSRGIAAMAGVLIIAPTAGRLLVDLGTNEAVLRLRLDDAVLVGFQIDVLPIAAGIGAALVATICELGERLQRDTDGLV